MHVFLSLKTVNVSSVWSCTLSW